MSKFKPDLFPQAKKTESSYWETVADSTIKPEIPKDLPKTPKDDVINIIDSYSKGLGEDDLKLFNFAFATAKTAHNQYDSAHYFYLFQHFFMASIKKTFPDKNFEELEKILENAKLILEKNLKDDNVENMVYMPFLLGITRALL